jgi:hypothetical protein
MIYFRQNKREEAVLPILDYSSMLSLVIDGMEVKIDESSRDRLIRGKGLDQRVDYATSQAKKTLSYDKPAEQNAYEDVFRKGNPKYPSLGLPGNY